MCRTRHDFNTEICSRGSGDISSANAESVNMVENLLFGDRYLVVLCCDDDCNHKRHENQRSLDGANQPAVLSRESWNQEWSENERGDRNEQEALVRDFSDEGMPAAQG